MVIIAREFAVTVLRAAAGAGQGLVISASPLGKLKTGSQVLMVMLLIAFHGRPLGVSLVIYATVAITVLSGADYFFGLRRRLAERERQRATQSA
jgi:CDP-diacylglycerol--glycerol-3-phosphate 3-phosphatidyltransferase